MRTSRSMYWSMLFALLAASPIAAGADEPGRGFDGYAGVGAITFPRYAGGAGYQVWAVPLLDFEYDETYYLHIKRAGARFWSNADRKLALGVAAEPRFGFGPGDGPRLSGMARRRDSIEGGPSLDWDAPLVSVNVAYFTDWSHASAGHSARVGFYRQVLDDDAWDVSAYAEFERDDRRLVQYYFGVRPEEATASRPAYAPGGAMNSTFGIGGAYRISKRYAVLFDGEWSTLGTSASASPIVERKAGWMFYVGVGFVLGR